MTALVDFLNARLDEDEQIARDAGSGRWTWSQEYGEMCNDPTCPYGQLVSDRTVDYDLPAVLMDVHGYDVKQGWQGAAHIARHDPARVLADIQAKRAILEAYRVERARRDAYQADAARAIENAEQAGSRRNAAARCRGLEIAVEFLAQLYVDHVDFRQEWKLATM